MHVNVVALVSLQNIDGSALVLGVTRADPKEETAAHQLFFDTPQVVVFNEPIEQCPECSPAGSHDNSRGDGSSDCPPGCDDCSRGCHRPNVNQDPGNCAFCISDRFRRDVGDGGDARLVL